MYRLFVIGAGFSKPAGLPLGDELFGEVLKRAQQTVLYENILQPDITRFVEYKAATTGESLTESDIDFEEFISFLDIEHFLGFKGSDTWNDEGNRSQLVIRGLLAQTIWECMDSISEKQLEPYLAFAERLDREDWIFTFNYDTIIEQCLDRIGTPYRLFPDRYSSVDHFSATTDTSMDEVVVLKMHGSIDWFDIAPFVANQDYGRQNPMYYSPTHLIFSNSTIFQPDKIVSGPRFPDSLLDGVYRAGNLDRYFNMEDFWSQPPLILSPSYSKILYSNPLKEFWNGFNAAGALSPSVVVVGFSLPAHDDYVRQALFALIRNFQEYEHGLRDFPKTRLKMVDYRQSEDEKNAFRQHYRFVDWAKTDCYFDGFGHEAIRMIFEEE